MSYSSPKKMLKQIGGKPAKLKKYNKYNVSKERNTGKSLSKCERCGNTRGIINKYGLSLCRRCFRDIATDIGFKKYD